MDGEGFEPSLTWLVRMLTTSLGLAFTQYPVRGGETVEEILGVCQVVQVDGGLRFPSVPFGGVQDHVADLADDAFFPVVRARCTPLRSTSEVSGHRVPFLR